MELRTYFDFADSDYKYLMDSYEMGWVNNAMGSIAQNTCERYMKHLIDKYDTVGSDPQNSSGEREHTQILRTHSLNTLIKYLDDNLGIRISDEARMEMMAIDGFYFTARYPGDDSIQLDRFDIEHSVKAATLCRREILISEKEILEQKIADESSVDKKIEYANRLAKVNNILSIPDAGPGNHETQINDEQGHDVHKAQEANEEH